jgi:hypothetical protein
LIVCAILALPFTLLFLCGSDICWNSEGVERELQDNIAFIPTNLLVLTNVVLISMWWTYLCRRIRGPSWGNPSFLPHWLSVQWKPKPPERIDRGRPCGKNKREQKRQQLQVALEVFAKGPSLTDRIFHHNPTKRHRKFLLSALQIATAISKKGIPNLSIAGDRCLRRDMRQYKRKGLVMTTNLKQEDLVRLRQVLTDYQPQAMLSNNIQDSITLTIDSGCSHSATGCKDDFLPGTLIDLPKPFEMEGIAGGLTVHQKGRVKYEVLTDDSDVHVIETSAYYMPDLPCRLFSPQSHFQELFINGKDNHEKSGFTIKRNRGVLTWETGRETTIELCETTHLPQLRVFQNALESAKALALKGCVTDEVNQNLTGAQKLALRYHFRLGHIAFNHVQWLGRQGWLGPEGVKMGKASISNPKCAACQFGKQARTPTPGKRVQFDDSGALSKDQTKPGQRIFVDQYESRVPGRTYASRGGSSSLKFVGGTLFYDAASGFISVHHQHSFTAAETVQSKMRFEQEALQAGVAVDCYHTDNGVFKAREFLQELSEKGQGIRYSGVSAHFQNGAAENGIKLVVRNARTMMLHVALRWPGYAEQELWPMAMSHAVHLWNHTPKMGSGLAPIEVFTGSKSDHSYLLNAHPWGCPVYVLEPKLRDGHKLPKWEPRSKRGQYMGISPSHASSVHLVRNLQTGSITPQYHLVFDDFFETVFSEGEQEPTVWQDLVVFNSFANNFDDEEYQPELAAEWLNPKELEQRVAAQEQERERLVRGHTKEKIELEKLKPMENEIKQMVRNVESELPAVAIKQERQQPVIDLSTETEPDAVPTTEHTPTLRETTQPPDHERRYPLRTRRPTKRLIEDESFLMSPRNLVFMGKALLQNWRTTQTDYRYIVALLTSVDTLGLEAVHPAIAQFPSALKAATKDPDSPSFQEAMTGPYREEFLEAMRTEISELEAHNCWDVVAASNLPEGAKILPTMWVFKIKRFPDGRVRRFKARLVVRGDFQVEGVDYDEKYAPVVPWSTVRLLLSIAASQGLETRQVDFSNAFVQAHLNEPKPIYVQTPATFFSDIGEKTVLRLNRSLYGLVQAPLYWGNHLRDVLVNQHGFTASELSPCLYYRDGVIILTYVDDCLFFAKEKQQIDKVLEGIRTSSGLQFTIEDDAFTFLGVELKRHEDGTVEFLQRSLIKKILSSCKMTDCNTKSTPANQSPLGTDANGPTFDRSFDYASIVGMMMYLSSNSRPDIQFAVHQCARFTHAPKRSHGEAILRICRYLQGTKERGLRFKPTEMLKLDCYCDADFAGLYNVENHQDPVCVKSRTGFCLTLGDCPLLWVSKLQSEIALSTTEAEYIALSQAIRELLPMRSLFQEVGTVLNLKCATPTILHSTVFEDNNGALALATSPKITPRTKHIAVKYHHFRSKIGPDKGIIIQRIDTNKQKADIFTKGLGAQQFAYIRALVMGWSDT